MATTILFTTERKLRERMRHQADALLDALILFTTERTLRERMRHQADALLDALILFTTERTLRERAGPLTAAAPQLRRFKWG